MKLSIIKRYKGEANFATSNIITSCVTMATGVIAAIFIAPEELGVIQTVLLINTYVGFLGLGIGSGLNRNLAFYKAKGDLVTMQDEIDTTYIFTYWLSLISGLLGICVFLYYLLCGYDNIYLWSCLLMMANLVLVPLITTIEVTYKSGQEFGRLGNIKNIQSLVYLITAFLPAVIGFLGRIFSSSINLIVGLFLRMKNPPYKKIGKGSVKAFKDLLYTGFPMFVSGYISGLIGVMDKTYIAAGFGAREVGLYTIAGYCMTIFMMIPSSVCVLLYPKAAATYGATGRKDSLVGFWWKSMLLLAIVLLPIIVIGYFLLPIVVNYIMPKYSEGIEAARITLLTCATFIYFGPSSLFGTLRCNKVNILFQLLLLGLFWLIVSVAANYFSTLESVAWLRFFLSLIQMAFVIAYTRYLLKD